MDTFATRFRMELARKRLTYREIAEFLGVSKSTVGNLATGETKPTLEVLESMTRLTGRSIDYFMTGADTIPALRDDERRVLDQYRHERDTAGLSAEEAVRRLAVGYSGVGAVRDLGNVNLSEFTQKRFRDAKQEQPRGEFE